VKEHFFRIFKHRATLPITTGIIGFGVGYAFCHILNNRKKPPTHELPEQMKFDYDALEAFIDEHEKKEEEEDENEEWVVIRERQESEPIDTSDWIIESNEEAIARLGKGEEITKSILSNQQDSEVVSHTIFAENTDEWNYEEEVKNRSPDVPYVLHKDEFFADEMGFWQVTFTYYAGDDILVDDEESPVYNHQSVTGPMLFGHGSDDPNVFYVRNEKRRLEYEIIKDSGLYSKEVLGLDIPNNERVKNLRHDKQVIPKFRED
jgi:hypothetical protein